MAIAKCSSHFHDRHETIGLITVFGGVEMELKVISFNIRNADDPDGNSVVERAPRLKKVLDAYDSLQKNGRSFFRIQQLRHFDMRCLTQQWKGNIRLIIWGF